jgi:hypothetical protein
MRHAYRTLLQLYPEDYRALFAAEMCSAFDKAAAERRAQGASAFVRFALTECIGMTIGAGAEWLAKLTTDASVRGRCLPDLRMMRPPGVTRELWFAGARISAGPSSAPHKAVDAQSQMPTLIGRIAHAIANHRFPGARSRSCEEREAQANLRPPREKHQLGSSGSDRCS